MNAWLLIALSLLSTTARASVSNVLAKHFVQAGEDARLFNTIAGLAASALLFIVSASREPDGTGMLPLALVFGLVYFAAFTSYSKAMSLGPMSYTSLATSLGMVLPVIAGPLVWGESIRPLQLFALLVMMAGIALPCITKGGEGVRLTRRWVFWALISFISSGSINIIQKVFANSTAGSDQGRFMAFTFLFFSIFSLLSLIPGLRGRPPLSGPRIPLSLLQGVCDSLQHGINLALASMLPSIVLFPVLNGGASLLAVLVSVVAFHERPGKADTVSLTLLVASILMLSMS